MAIFIGDKPTQMVRQAGQTIQNIQKEYEAEKLRREEYVDQYDAAESDFATLKSEFKPILSKYVNDILQAQTSVEETNSSESREKLRSLSREYEQVKAISEAQSQAITRGLADARAGKYYQTEEEVSAQIRESLADLTGMTGEQLLNSKYADPNFIMFQATPYDKAVDMIDVTKYSDRAAKIVGNQVGRVYSASGRLKVDEARASLGEQAELLYKSSPQALKAAAYMYADQNHPDGIEAVQSILEDEKLMEKAKEVYKQAYIESALPMITDRIAVDKGRGEGEDKMFNFIPTRGEDIKFQDKSISGATSYSRVGDVLITIEDGRIKTYLGGEDPEIGEMRDVIEIPVSQAGSMLEQEGDKERFKNLMMLMGGAEPKEKKATISDSVDLIEQYLKSTNPFDNLNLSESELAAITEAASESGMTIQEYYNQIEKEAGGRTIEGYLTSTNEQ